MFPDSTGELLGELEVSSGATAADFSARLSLKVSSLHSNASGGRAADGLPGNSLIKAVFT